MRNLQNYKIFESTKPGTSVGEIRDLLADLIDSNFYIEVNLDHDVNNEETIDEGPVGVDKDFNIVIMTQYQFDYDPIDEEEDKSKSRFSWDNVSDSVNQLIDFLKDRYALKRCKANMILPNRKNKMDNFILDVAYDEVDDEKLPIDLDNEEAEQNIKGQEPFIYIDDKIICNVCIEFGPKKKKEEIKKFEEFDWHSLIHDSTFQTISGWAIANVLIRIGAKYIKAKNRKKYYSKMMSGENSRHYTRGRWEFEENDSEIIIYRHLATERKVQYILNKSTREFKIPSLNFTGKEKDTWSIKLSKEEFNEILSNIKWVKEVSSTIEDFYYDLKDDGYEPHLRHVDFKHRGIVVTLERVQVEPRVVDEYPDEDVWDQGGGPYYDDGKKFAVLDILEHIEEFVSQIEGAYGVKIDDNYKQDDSIYRNERILKSNSIPDFKNNIKDASLFNVRTLVIPFIKK